MTSGPWWGGRTQRPASSRGANPVELIREQLSREQARLEERRRDLAVASEILERLTSEPVVIDKQPGFEPISDELAPAVVSQLMRESSGPLRNLVMLDDSGPAFDTATRRDNITRLEAGHDQLSIYPAAVLDTAPGRQWVAEWAERGEQQRIVEAPPTEFAVFGDLAVVGLRRWGDPSSGYAIFREPLMVFGFKEYFDLAWQHALPLPSGQLGDRADERIVELLALGLKDEAIARLLGTSLRTVRRRISALMDTHGVKTRFQLGAVLAQRAVAGSHRRRR